MKRKVFWLFVAIAVFLLIASTVSAQSGIFDGSCSDPNCVYLPIIYKFLPPTFTSTTTLTTTPTSTPTPTPTNTSSPTATSTSTPTATVTPTSTSTPTATATYAFGVQVLDNHTTRPSAGGSYRYVIGEIFNNTSAYLRFVKISVNFFNDSQLVETDYTYTHLENVHPYEKACFKIMLNNPSTWTNYSFEPVSYWTDGEARPNLYITSHSGGIYSTYYYRILGQIRNDESQQIRFVSAAATVYDNAGKVVDCDYGYVNSTDLNAGQSSSFTILSDPPVPSAVAFYTLQTDGVR